MKLLLYQSIGFDTGHFPKGTHKSCWDSRIIALKSMISYWITMKSHDTFSAVPHAFPCLYWCYACTVFSTVNIRGAITKPVSWLNVTQVMINNHYTERTLLFKSKKQKKMCLHKSIQIQMKTSMLLYILLIIYAFRKLYCKTKAMPINNWWIDYCCMSSFISIFYDIHMYFTMLLHWGTTLCFFTMIYCSKLLES